MKLASRPIRIAILDLNNNTPNEGIRCLREILLSTTGNMYGLPIEFKVFDVRYRNEIPDLSFDVFISSGGPGSPLGLENADWEKKYFSWLEKVWNHNIKAVNDKKYVCFICFSFELMIRYFELALLTRRRSQSFGILPVHKTPAGRSEIIFSRLGDPFFCADFREWQVTEPDNARLYELGAEIIALEKIRPHVELERALMAVRLSAEFVGIQFHPEADPRSMLVHFQDQARKEKIISECGQDKYNIILHRLQDPNYLNPTRETVLPNFLNNAIENLRPEVVFNFSG